MTIKQNITWVAISQISKITIQILALIILTRLITPAQYGIMAIALTITNFALIFRDLGTSAAIIQKKELNHDIVSSIFWLNLIMGSSICIIIIFLSPLASEFYNEKTIFSLLILLAFSFPLSSLSAVHQSLLERNSKFKTVAFIEITSSFLGLISAIVIASLGGGVYSLAGQTLVTTLLSTIIYWRISNFRPKVTLDTPELKNLISFSGNLTLFNFINYFSRNSDIFIIGKYFSIIILGSYSLAYRVMLFPIQSLSLIASRALFPIMSKIQDDLIEIQNLYLKTMAIIASITAPLMGGLVIIRTEFVNVSFGSQWVLVPSLLLWLAPIGFIQSLISVTGSLLVAKGKTKVQMYLGLISSILSIIAFIVGANKSIYLLVQLYLAANVISAIISLFVTLKIIGVSFFKLCHYVLPSIISSFIMIFSLYFINEYIIKAYNFLQHDIIMIIVMIISGVIIYLISYRLLFKQILNEISPANLKHMLFM